MISPKALEAWFTLMAEAARGSSEGQTAMKALAESLASPEAMNQWMARFLPAASTSARPEAFEAWLEEWWRMMGVVPRSRYLELLEQYDLLQRRLEKAEETIRRLKAALGNRDHDIEARQVLDLWETMLQESLKIQSDWMRTWTGPHDRQAPAAPPAGPDSNQEAEPPQPPEPPEPKEDNL